MRRIFQPVRNLAARAAMDRAVAYALFGQVWSILAGPVSIWLIARLLTAEEQGYYYTFGSLLAVQLFFELGLTTLLVTFAAHEKARLSWSDGGELAGEPRALSRLGSLLHASVRWYTVLAAGFAVAVVPFGVFFFRRHEHGLPGSAWLAAWLGMVVATALNLLIVPGVAVLEGCGLVKQTYLARLVQTVVSNAVFWLALLAGGKLLAAGLSSLLGWVVMAAWLFGYRRLFANLWRRVGEDRISWRREIWPLQWKMACSWISGYFIFQLFTPVLFAYHGPAAAARMGMSLNLLNRINAFSLTWITAKAPRFATLVASGDYSALDRVFFRSGAASLLVAIVLAGTLWLLTLGLQLVGSPYADRLLDLPSLALLGGGTLISIVAYGEATYMRAHKEEPLVYIWAAFSLVIGASIYLAGRRYGALGMAASYCGWMGLVCGAIVTPYFLARRARWQTDNALRA